MNRLVTPERKLCICLDSADMFGVWFCYQGDENDPELAYRDIAKFNIVQVAGMSVDARD